MNEDLKELIQRYTDTFADYRGIEINDVNQRGMGEDTLLHLAASHSDIKDVELLLDNGAEANAKGDIGLTPLHLAASKGRLDIVKLLIRRGARKDIKNDFGETPVERAENNNQKDVVTFLS